MKLPQIREERELLLKKIYDYCIKVNWQKTKLDELARELGTTRTNLRNLAKKYAKEKLSPDDYERLIKQLDEIISFERKDTKAKLTIINPILLKTTGKSTYLLWETAEEKKLILQYIYEYCTNENWDKFKIEKLAKELGLTSSKIKELAKKYAKEYLTSEKYQLLKQEFNDKSIKERELNKITLTVINPILYQELGKTTFLLWETAEEKELVLKYIFFYCDQFNFSSKKIEQLSDYLGISLTKINEYYKEYAFNYLKWTKEQYHKKRCEYMQINRQKKEPETKKRLITPPKITDDTINKIKQMTIYIKYGIKEYNIIRPFDIIDYYLNIKIPLNNILELTKRKITNEEYLLLRAFVVDNKDATKNDYSKKLKITEEENEIITFLSNNDIPINSITYNIAYRRYINGTLNLNLTKKSK